MRLMYRLMCNGYTWNVSWVAKCFGMHIQMLCICSCKRSAALQNKTFTYDYTHPRFYILFYLYLFIYIFLKSKIYSALSHVAALHCHMF